MAEGWYEVDLKPVGNVRTLLVQVVKCGVEIARASGQIEQVRALLGFAASIIEQDRKGGTNAALPPVLPREG